MAGRQEVFRCYRRILRLADLFPDDVGAMMIRIRCREMFRRGSTQTEPQKVTELIAAARQAARRISHAVAGERTAVMRVFNLTFGRSGPMKHVFLKLYGETDPESAAKSKRKTRSKASSRIPTAAELAAFPPVAPECLAWLEAKANDPSSSRVWRRHYRHFLHRVPVGKDDNNLPVVSRSAANFPAIRPEDLIGYTPSPSHTSSQPTGKKRGITLRTILASDDDLLPEQPAGDSRSSIFD